MRTYTQYREIAFHLPTKDEIEQLYNDIIKDEDDVASNINYTKFKFIYEVEMAIGDCFESSKIANSLKLLTKEEIKRSFKVIQRNIKNIQSKLPDLQHSIGMPLLKYGININNIFLDREHVIPPHTLFDYTNDYLEQLNQIINLLQKDLKQKKRPNTDNTDHIDNLMISLFRIFSKVMMFENHPKDKLERKIIREDLYDKLELFVNRTFRLSGIYDFSLTEGADADGEINASSRSHLRKLLKPLLLK